MSTRPLFPFYGSKWNTARYYPAPTHSTVIEPFAGSAGYSLYYGARRAVLCDADPIIVGVWDFLIRSSESEVLRLPLLPNVGDNVDDYQMPQEARWLIGFWLNRGSAAPKKSRTAYSARTDKGQLNWGEKARARIASGLESIRDWRVILGPYSQAPDESATWFVDPPYEDKGRHYRVPFSAFDSLASWARTRRGQVMVCENAGATWLPFRPLGKFKSSRGCSVEVVWSNETKEVKS